MFSTRTATFSTPRLRKFAKLQKSVDAISTLVATRSVALVLSLLLMTFHTSVVMAENEGLEDLDKATDLQLRVENLQDLDQVVSLCESAIEKGLDKDNTEFAKQLIVSSLWQHAKQLSAAIFDAPRPHPQWPNIRELITKDIDKLLKYDESFAEAHVLNAKLQALPGGDREKSLKSVGSAIESFEKRKDQQELAKTYLLRAQLRENADERIADIEAAIKADPTSVEAKQLRAAAHIDQGEMDEAIAIFSDAIELAPENALNYAMRAEVYEAQEKYDEALADLTQALKIQPNSAAALLARARLNYFKENLDEARADINRLLEARPGLSQGVLLRSMIEAAGGDYQKAIADLQKILRADPTNVNLQMQLASLYTADERPRKAIQVLSGIVAADEGNWRALRSRGDALLSVGKHAEAIEDYDQALKIQSEPPEDEQYRDVWLNILNNLAWVLSTSPKDEVRNGTRAIELATRACEASNFGKAHIISTLAAAYAETGDFENAVKWSKKCVELGVEELPDQIEQLRDELKHYEEGKPFRELQDVQEKLDPPARVLDT